MLLRLLGCGSTLLLLLGACTGERPATGVGLPAPAYAATTLEGDTVALAELRGDVVLLNVWATWCPPCRKEMPELQKLQDEYAARGLRIVGVSIDAPGADGVVREFAREYGIGYELLRDPGEEISTVFSLHGVPATILIDRAGIVRWRQLGPITADDRSLRNALQHALDTPRA